MGVYDTVSLNGREGQVKAWDRDMKTFHEGSVVGGVDGQHTYSIGMKEGGFVNVRHGLLESWTDRAAYRDVFDKYGNRWSSRHERGYLFGRNDASDQTKGREA